MTDEEIFDLAETHGWMDDFGRWNFKDDGLISFALEVLKAEREACARLCETECAMNDGITCAEEIRARGDHGIR